MIGKRPRWLLVVVAALALAGLGLGLGRWLGGPLSDSMTGGGPSGRGSETLSDALLASLRQESDRRRLPGLSVLARGLGSLRGTVQRHVSEAGPQPLPGVTVLLVWHAEGMDASERTGDLRRATAVTNEEGTFLFENVPALFGGVLVVRQAPFRDLQRRGILVQADQVTDVGTLLLGAPTVLRGTVVDSRGRPLEGASVEVHVDVSDPRGLDVRRSLFDLQALASPLAASISRSDGSFLLRDVPPGRYALRISAPGHAALFRAGVTITVDERSSPLRIVLDPGAGYEGTVLDGEDRPIAGARLTAVAIPGDRMQRVDRVDVRSDRNGSYRIHSLVPGLRYLVEVWADGFAPQGTLLVPREGVEAHDFVLVEGGRVEGTIRDDLTGDPIPGAEVTLVTGSPVNPGLASAVTGVEGRYEVDSVAPGPVLALLIAAPGYQQFDEAHWVSIRGLRVEPARTLALDHRLRPGARVFGQVQDQSGRPIPYATVVVVEPKRRWRGTLTSLTDAKGGYAIAGLAAGIYDVSVRAPGYAPLLPAGVRRLQVPESLGEIRRDLILDAGAAFAGVIRSPSGDPVGGARVGVEVQGPRAERDAVKSLVAISDSLGRYRLGGVPPGLLVTVVAEHDAWVRASSNALVLHPGEERSLSLTLHLGAVLTGTCTDRDGTPLPGVGLRWGLVPQDNERRLRDAFSADQFLGARRVVTGANGAFRIEGLRAGSYLLKAEKEGWAPFYRRDVLVPGHGEPSPLDVHLRPALGIQGRVRSAASGLPIPGAYVYARAAGEQSDGETPQVRALSSAETDAAGSFSLEALPPGIYDVVVWYAPGHAAAVHERRSPDVRRKNVAAGSRSVEFHLPAASPPTGTAAR